MLPGFAFSSLFLGDHKRKPPRYPWFSHGFPISWSFWWNRPFCPGFFHWNPWDTRGFRLSQPASERGLAEKSARCLEATTGGLGSHQLLCCGDHMIMGSKHGHVQQENDFFIVWVSTLLDGENPVAS
jgi:hypothetical protein